MKHKEYQLKGLKNDRKKSMTEKKSRICSENTISSFPMKVQF